MKLTGAQILCESLIKEGVEVSLDFQGVRLSLYMTRFYNIRSCDISWYVMSKELPMQQMDMPELRGELEFVLPLQVPGLRI